MRRVVAADHSGDTYEFNGTVSPDFYDAFLDWVKEKTGNDEASPPDEVEISKDGAVLAKYNISDSTTISIEQKGGAMTASVYGDTNEVESPDAGWFEETTLVTNEGEVYITYHGKEYNLAELLKLVKQLDNEKSLKDNAAKVRS